MYDVQQLQTTRWEHRALGRYYEVHLTQDLWGAYELLRVWGRIGTPLGRIWVQPLAGRASAERVFAQVAKRRAQRGYTSLLADRGP